MLQTVPNIHPTLRGVAPPQPTTLRNAPHVPPLCVHRADDDNATDDMVHKYSATETAPYFLTPHRKRVRHRLVSKIHPPCNPLPAQLNRQLRCYDSAANNNLRCVHVGGFPVLITFLSWRVRLNSLCRAAVTPSEAFLSWVGNGWNHVNTTCFYAKFGPSKQRCHQRTPSVPSEYVCCMY